MKRIFLFFSLFSTLLLSSTSLMAQVEDESPEQQTFSFVYVALDNSMSVQMLTEQLRDAYNHAIMEGPTIFYFSRGSEPIIVRVNLPDDNRNDFEDLILAKVREQENSSVDGGYDKVQILKLLQEHNFIDESCHTIYGRTDFRLYVGQSFWTMSNHEAMIAPLYFELDIANFISDENFNFNVYCPRNIEFNNNAPFGILNPDGINDDIRLNKIL